MANNETLHEKRVLSAYIDCECPDQPMHQKLISILAIHLGGMCTLSGEANVNIVLPPSSNGLCSREDPFSDRIWCAERQTESHKSCLPYNNKKMAENLPCVSSQNKL